MMDPFYHNNIVIIILVILLLSFPKVNSYTILGGIDPPKKEQDPEQSNIITQTLRHLQSKDVQLRTQSHELSGRVSMAGTLWEGSTLLADYITNPKCKLEAFQRKRMVDNDDLISRQQYQPSTVVELGSGVGLASLAASFMGCRVISTDGAPSSIRLLTENFERYTSDCDILPTSSHLEWGDVQSTQSLLTNELNNQLPDVIMASDVVYALSARDELSKTIRQLCPRGHTTGRIVMAHRWRANAFDEEKFFASFDDEFDREEVGLEFMPEDGYHNRRSMMDMRYPISIFEMRRKF
mmetsp:Transcript_15299/g.17592  ORF Transcript_15299/g.17592 Transcript_15299/m.17592 type:complete len:295 (+) Transcript_15299:109-993(+)